MNSQAHVLLHHHLHILLSHHTICIVRQQHQQIRQLQDCRQHSRDRRHLHLWNMEMSPHMKPYQRNAKGYGINSKRRYGFFSNATHSVYFNCLFFTGFHLHHFCTLLLFRVFLFLFFFCVPLNLLKAKANRIEINARVATNLKMQGI